MTDSTPAPDKAPAPDPTPAAAPSPDAASSPSPAPQDAASSPAPAVEPAAPAPAAAVTLDQRTRRKDDDPIEGHAVQVVDGEHAGQTAVFLAPVTHDPQTGYPVEILIRFKSTSYSQENAVVALDAVRPAEHPGHQ